MKNKSQGFSLIELAIVMIGLGVLFALIAPIYTLYQKNQALSATDRNVQAVSAAIANFRTLHGRYPCPAPLSVDRTDPKYGREGSCSSGTYSVLAFGNCHSTGICRQRSIDSRIDASGWIPSLVGAIPFRTLNLQENEAYDGYDMRLRYVVTESLTDSATFDLDGGGVEIRNDQDNSLLDVPGSAHFVIISHGPNKVGAYTKAGSQIPCTGSGPEIQNCLMSPGGGPGPSGCSGSGGMCTVYRAVQNSTNPASYYDDNLTYFVRDDIPLWTTSSADPLDIHQASVSGDVGFGVDPDEPDPTQDATVGSGGIIRTMEALMAHEFCNMYGNECFQSSLIAGIEADGSGGLICPPGEFMVGIQNGQAVCDDDITIRCPYGKFIIGFNTDNTFKCAAGACEPTSVGICSDVYNLPLGLEGQSLTFEGGINRYKTYTCTSTGWKVTDDNADESYCSCDAADEYPETVSTDCASVDGWSGTGTIDQQRDFVCDLNSDGIADDPGWTDWTITNNSCICNDGDTDTDSPSCDPGWTGDIVMERTHSCDPNGDGLMDDAGWGPWVEISNTCTCTPQTDDRTLGCPTGFVGTNKIYQENTFTCPDAEWSGWKTISNDCTCDSTTPPQTLIDPDCDAGYTGTRDKIRYFECPAGTWGPWQVTDDNCTKNPVAYCNWKTSGTGNASTYAISREQKGGSCVCGEEGPCYEYLTSDSYYNYNVCRCE